MGTKMKGIFKGLRCISHIFEDEKEEEFQIGFPTDVKHVAHIGWDGHGPSVDSPSWMKDFKSPTTAQSGPLAPPGGETREGANEIKWVSEDSKRVHRKVVTDSPSNDRLPDVPKSSRRSSNHSKELNPNDSPKKKDRSRRRSKDSSKGGAGSVKSNRSKQCSEELGGSVKSNRSKECSEELGGSVNASDQNQSQEDSSPPPRGLPADLPKKSPRGKKSKELPNGSTQSRSKELVDMNAPSC